MAAAAVSVLLVSVPARADMIVGPQLNRPAVTLNPIPADPTGRLPGCTAGGYCAPSFGSSGRSGVRDYYRDLHPDLRGQRRWRPAGDVALPDRNYRQPDAYIDLDLNRPRYTPPPSVPRRIDGNPAISGRHQGWCQDRYRSYRASDDTFQPYEGPRRRCQSPYS